jgi:catalase
MSSNSTNIDLVNKITIPLGIGANKGSQLTTQTGLPVEDDQNTLKIDYRGPILIEDHIFREKITHFDHERIPERVVHARGFGVHGFYENLCDLSDVTCADLFSRVGEKTDVFVRFSTVIGNKGFTNFFFTIFH